MTEKKMTKAMWFEEIINVVKASEYERADEAVAMLEHEIELLGKKKSSGTKSKSQIENDAIMERIELELASLGKAVTISEFQKEVPEMAQYSNQKLSSLFKKLVDAEKAVKTTEKKKSYFSIAE